MSAGNDPIRVVTSQDEWQEEVRQILEESKNKGMTDVVIVGSMPAGRYYFRHSGSRNWFEQIGYLEQAKHEIMAMIREEDR